MGLLEHTCHPSTGEVEAGGDFKANLGYILRSCFEEEEEGDLVKLGLYMETILRDLLSLFR